MNRGPVFEPGGPIPVAAESELVVVGGGPAGIAAAVAAAREGLSVTLVERYPYLGGLASGGMVLVLDDMCNGDEISVRGLCWELIDRMESMGLCVTPPEADRRSDPALWRKWSRWGLYDFHSRAKPQPICYAAAFDPDGFKRACNAMVAESKINLRLHSWFSRAIVEDGNIVGVICESKSGRQAILGKIVIDASGDLDVAASAGAPFVHGAYIVTTVFRLGGVDVEAAEKFEYDAPEAFSALDREARKLIGGSWEKWWLKTPLPGVVWCNCPHMTGFDGVAVEDLRAPILRDASASPNSSRMCVQKFRDLRELTSIDVAPQLGVRQTRLLDGVYVMTKDDVADRRHFQEALRPRQGLLLLVPKPAAERGAPLAGRRPPLFGDPHRAKNVAGDSALHGDGRSGRDRGGARARGGQSKSPRSTSALCNAAYARAARTPATFPPPTPPPFSPPNKELPMSSSDPQPLTGVSVLDFTQVMLGPSATQALADYGADVVKVERPGAGDLSRSSISGDPDGMMNPVFRSLNRNKRSIALDLRKPEAKELIYELVRDVDVVVNNFRAGVMERIGFGYERLAKINPRIICAFGSGFGQKGPLAYKGGQDILAQALSGVMRRKCNDDEPLTVYATSLCDYTAGMHLVQAICSRCCSGRRPAADSRSPCRSSS